jgi:hypothetical protein
MFHICFVLRYFFNFFIVLPWPLDRTNSVKKYDILFEDQKQTDFCNGGEENSDIITRQISFLTME